VKNTENLVCPSECLAISHIKTTEIHDLFLHNLLEIFYNLPHFKSLGIKKVCVCVCVCVCVYVCVNTLSFQASPFLTITFINPNNRILKQIHRA
jgi:hypothetical protein